MHYSEYEVLPKKGHVNLAVDKDLFLETPMPCCPKKELVDLVVDKDLLLESPMPFPQSTQGLHSFH